MAPQRWRAGRGIRLNPREYGPARTHSATSGFLGCWSRECLIPVQTPRESKWLSPHRSQWARVTLI